MIHTLTMNPSLDYIVDVADFRPGTVNRTAAERILPGGKGLNVSVVLQNLGVATHAVCLTAGFTGAEIGRLLRERGIRADCIELAHGFSRINVKLRAGAESEINGRGPDVQDADRERLARAFSSVQGGDVLVLAGSVPPALPADFYGTLIERLAVPGVRVVVDAAGDLLKNTLPRRPFLIKPNRQELGALFGTEIAGRAEAAMYARKLQEQGARNVLVSLGAEGAVLATEDGELYAGSAPRGGTPVNSVGAGDSMVAGFLAALERGAGPEEALLTGLCAGTASACSGHLADGATVESLRARHPGIERLPQ